MHHSLPMQNPTFNCFQCKYLHKNLEKYLWVNHPVSEFNAVSDQNPVFKTNLEKNIKIFKKYLQ